MKADAKVTEVEQSEGVPEQHEKMEEEQVGEMQLEDVTGTEKPEDGTADKKPEDEAEEKKLEPSAIETNVPMEVAVDAPIKPTVLGHGAQGLATAEGANEDADAEGLLEGFAACSSFFICMCCCCCFVCMAPGVGILIWLLVAWGMHMDDDCDQPLQMWVGVHLGLVIATLCLVGCLPACTKRNLTEAYSNPSQCLRLTSLLLRLIAFVWACVGLHYAVSSGKDSTTSKPSCKDEAGELVKAIKVYTIFLIIGTLFSCSGSLYQPKAAKAERDEQEGGQKRAHAEAPDVP